MKNIFSRLALIAIASILSASTLLATPIYMKFDGIDGDVSVKAEVKNGKASFKNLKPGSYNVTIHYTGLEMKGADGKPRAKGHVKVFDGRTQLASTGGLNVATGDVNGDGTAAMGSTSGAGAGKVSMQDFHFTMKTADGKTSQSAGAGKVSMQDIHFSVKPNRGKTELSGQIGTVKLVGPSDSQGKIDSFFDIFTEISLN